MSSGISERRMGDGAIRYAVRVRRGGQNAFGVFDTLPEAQAHRAAVLAAIATGKPVPGAPRPKMGSPAPRSHDRRGGSRVGERHGQWGSHRPARAPLQARDNPKVERRLRLHVLPRIGAMPIVGVRRGDVRRLVDDLAVEGSPQTARNALDALRVVFRLQVDREVVEINVCSGVRVPAVVRREARLLSREESLVLTKVAEADRNAMIGPMVVLALASGCRKGELLALPWGPTGLDLEQPGW